jgi:hypothetical protein
MRRAVNRLAIFVVAALVAVFVAAIAVVALSGDRALRTEDLSATDPQIDELAGPTTEHVVRFHGLDDSVMATANIESRQLNDSLFHLRVSIQQEPATRLGSLRLTFEHLSPGPVTPPPMVALAPPPGFPWPAIEFHTNRNAEAVVLNVPDLGEQGQGTVTLDFYLGPALNQPELPETLLVSLDFTLRGDQLLTLTQRRGQAEVDVRFP